MIRPPEPEDLRAFTGRVVRLLEERGVRYAICGSMAAMEYSEPRLSIDVDVMVIVEPSTLMDVVETIGEWGVYVPPSAVIREEILPNAQPFNIIDGLSGSKVDIYPVPDSGLTGSALRRRRRRVWDVQTETEAWFLAPEDVILSKLQFYKAGGEVSQKHPTDIAKMLRVVGTELDEDYIERWAGELGLLDLWLKLRDTTR